MMRVFFLILILLASFASCRKSSEFEMQTRIDPLLKQMEIGKENLMIIMLFNDFCDPCVNQILGLTERLDSLEFGGKKILLVVKDGKYDKKSFNTLKSYDVHRHQIESA